LHRRRFFHVAGLGAATLLVACGEENKGQGPIAGEKAQESAPEPAESDVADVNVLNSALDLEHQAVAAYTAAMKVLRGENLRAARTLRDQERAHVQALSRAIQRLGGRPNQAQRDYRFPRLRTEDEVLRFAIRLENTAISAYIDALPQLNSADLRAEGAAIVANEAQHLAVLNGALRERAAPTAFVTGEAAR
jgi:rubrerythrin